MFLDGRPVLVGDDGAGPAVSAVRWATAEAHRREVSLQVVHVPRQGVLDAPPALVARRLVEASHGAALLVVGHRRRGEAVTVIVGSVAGLVAAQAHCPVVVVGEDAFRRAGPRNPVVVGVDGSGAATSALIFAATVAAETGASLTVVAAHGPAGAHAEATAAAHAAGCRAVAAHPALTVERRVEWGRAAGVLAAAAADAAGLVVVGSRGLGAVTGLVLGSTSRHLIRTAPCPVAVLR